jgi:hypothetical protein
MGTGRKFIAVSQDLVWDDFFTILTGKFFIAAFFLAAPQLQAMVEMFFILKNFIHYFIYVTLKNYERLLFLVRFSLVKLSTPLSSPTSLHVAHTSSNIRTASLNSVNKFGAGFLFVQTATFYRGLLSAATQSSTSTVKNVLTVVNTYCFMHR